MIREKWLEEPKKLGDIIWQIDYINPNSFKQKLNKEDIMSLKFYKQSKNGKTK